MRVSRAPPASPSPLTNDEPAPFAKATGISPMEAYPMMRAFDPAELPSAELRRRLATLEREAAFLVRAIRGGRAELARREEAAAAREARAAARHDPAPHHP